ncbi:GntR family transcriptional regulator [Streptomyces sp. 71268]|uniref:GntR family transcriptional regulator n=1 Tax=Streptomyces sp. 71268 TaxID=3002640 RepID=UPI0023F71551|nr:GntR family transcriptional regulator [Streptomyces sp. 71268]WEV24069.1 GntR family transcriptional regulator [Streptomyces sp. 71268]
MSGLSALPALSSASLASRRETVADVLREAITVGQLTAGQKLTEAGVAAQLGTSRAPVREALRQLEQEGLVISYPYRGTEVLGVSQEEIENVLVPVRVSLEKFAFRKAMPLLTDADYAHLDSLVRNMAAAADAADAATLADEDIRFHEAVVTLSGQQHCLQIWRSIQPRVRSYFRRDASRYADATVVAEQHRELVDALRAGDERALDRAVTAHITTHLGATKDPAE